MVLAGRDVFLRESRRIIRHQQIYLLVPYNENRFPLPRDQVLMQPHCQGLIMFYPDLSWSKSIQYKVMSVAPINMQN